MPNVVYGYTIKSNFYNKSHSYTEYYGLCDIFINAKANTPFFKKLAKTERQKKEKAILSDFIRRYDEYYFKEEDKHLYERQMKIIDKEIENEPDINNKRAIEKRKLKYIFVKTEKQQFLYNLAKKYDDDVEIEWKPRVKGSIGKKKNDDCVIKGVIERYINADENKNKIIYHNLNKTTEEIKNDRIKRAMEWNSKNPEKHKELKKNWAKKNAHKINEYNKKSLYFKKLLPLTKEEVIEIEKKVEDIMGNNCKKDAVNKLCEMIIEDKQNHIIIKKVIKELQQQDYFKQSISTKLTNLKKSNRK
jgi:hypothetical protein